MRNVLFSTQLAQLGTYVVLIVPLGALAAYFGSAWGWTPGAASLALLSVPACAAALSGKKVTAIVTALLAGGVCALEAGYSQAAEAGMLKFLFPVMASSALVATAWLVSFVVDSLRRRVEELESNNTRYVRDLYRRERETTSDMTVESDSALPAPNEPCAAENESANNSVDFALLLLALQDVGRRVSTNLDLQTLIPTIISSAKASLKCGECQLYLWNPRENTLDVPLPPRSRDQVNYVPRPHAGMSEWVLKHRQILTRKAVENDYSLHDIREQERHLPDAIAPLSVGGEIVGIVVVDHVEQDSTTFDRLLYILANIFALGIKNAQLFQRIEEMARRDGLTGLLNHASFQQELHSLAECTASDASPLTIIMSDIDHFKSFNDRYGHQAGDHVLREVARLWGAVLPDDSVVARYGGEEFICALPGDDLQRGLDLAEELRREIECRTLDYQGTPLNVTASFGVAQLNHSTRTAKDLIRVADEAMYAAKAAGRNRVSAELGSSAVTA